MQLKRAKAFSYADARAPRVPDPVFAVPAVTVHYTATDTNLVRQDGINCSRAFATLVLGVIERWCGRYGFQGFAHVGVFNSRYARRPNGEAFTPLRWSNHSRGEAVDFKGIHDAQGNYLDIAAMKAGCPAKLAELINDITVAIVAAGRLPEIVWEPTRDNTRWIHLGIRP
jgi:hypothetical protein